MTSENKTSPSIRKAVAGDLPAIYRLFTQMDAKHAESAPFKYRRSEFRDWENFPLDEHLIRPDSMVLVADLGGTVTGVIYGVIEEAPPMPFLIARRYAYIRVVAVDAGYRRRGIGTALLDAADSWARSKDVDSVELTVAEFNAGAMDLYDRAGFTPVTRRMAKRLVEPTR